MVEILADRSAAETLGYIIGRLAVVGLGLALLIAGLYTRYRSRPTTPAALPASGYPGAPTYPQAPGYP
jgi:hypothetical protein